MTINEYLQTIKGTVEFYNLVDKKLKDIEQSYYCFSFEQDILNEYIITNFIEWLNSDIQEEVKEKEQ